MFVFVILAHIKIPRLNTKICEAWIHRYIVGFYCRNG